MKKSKKVVLFILSLVIVLSMTVTGIVTVNAEDSGYAVDTMEYRIGLLEALEISKISGVGITDWSGNLSRGEAAFLVAGILQLDRSRQETIFDDVSTDAYYAGAIASLYNSGVIIKEWGSKRYKPDESITYAEFIKMICKALGYGGYAEAKGGFPTGYLSVARQFKITNGVTGAAKSSALSKSYVPRIMMNVLDANYLTVSAIDKDGNQTATKQGTVLENYFGGYKYKGILEESGRFSITNDFLASDSQITVGGIVFNNSQPAETYREMLGYQVNVYYTENKKVLYVCPTDNNEAITLDTGDITKVSAEEIRYNDNDGNEKKLKLRFGYTPVYNGTVVNSFDSLKPDIGNIQLINNDGGNGFHIVKQTEYEIREVAQNNSLEKTIVLDDGTEVDIEGEREYFIFSSTNGKRAKIENLKRNAIILFAANEETEIKHKINDVIICQNTVDGVAARAGSDMVTVNGIDYEFTKPFMDNGAQFKVGQQYTLYLDKTGKVVFAKGAGYSYKDAKYAMFFGVEEGGTRLYPVLYVDMFTQDGTHVMAEVADSVKYNGVKYDKKDVEFINLMKAAPVNELIKYNMSDDGKVSEVFVLTAENIWSSWQPWNFGSGFNKYEVKPTAVSLANGAYYGESLYGIATDAIRFNIFDEDGSILDEKFWSVSNSVLSYRSTVYSDETTRPAYRLYDIDKAGIAHAFVIGNKVEGSAGSGTDIADLFAITKRMPGANEEGDTGYYVTGYLEGKIVTYFVNEKNAEDVRVIDINYEGKENEEEVSLTLEETLEPGNIIKIKVKGEEITSIGRNNDLPDKRIYALKDMIDVDAPGFARGEDEDRLFNRQRGDGRHYRSGFMAIATVVKIEDGMVYFAMGGETLGESADAKNAFTMKQAGLVYKYNKDKTGNDMFEIASWNDIKIADCDGPDSLLDTGSTLLVYVYEFGVRNIFILD